MRDIDIPNTLKVKNPGLEAFSLAGRITLRPNVISDVNLGALHDIHRTPVYMSLLTSIAGGALEYVSGPEGYQLPSQVLSAVQRRDRTDAEGAAIAAANAAAIADRPDGIPTLPTVKPPAPSAPLAQPVSDVVGAGNGDDFVPPPTGALVPPAVPPVMPPTTPAVTVPPTPPAPPAVPKTSGKGSKATTPSAPPSDSDPKAAPISDL